MIEFLVKKFRKSIFNRRYSTIGYLPRWIIFAIDVFIVSLACVVTYIILSSLNVKSYDALSDIMQYILIIFINAISFIFFRTYSGIIRHSTFIDGVKLLIATTFSFVVLMFINYSCQLIFQVKLFLSAGLFITYVISFLQLFLFRILVKNFFELHELETFKFV